MSLISRDPFDALMPLREAMNRLFEESFVGPRFELLTSRTFPIDVYETEDQQQYIIEASLPGVKPDDVKITAMGDTLTIHATQKREEKTGKGAYMRCERYEGEIDRAISLPTLIDAEKVQATYEHGVLTLHVPKAEIAKPKQIPVRIKELAGAR